MWQLKDNLREFLCGNGTVIYDDYGDAYANLHLWYNLIELYTLPTKKPKPKLKTKN